MANQDIYNDEIDLISIIKKVWKKRKIIIKISIFFIIVGVAAALLSPIVYTSSSTFILSSDNDKKASSLGGVASLVGINLDGISDDGGIPAIMYPTVLESVEFKRQLLNEYIDEDKTLKLKSFLID